VSGLYQVRNRYYNSSLSAFVSRDPLSYAAGDLNLYRYVGNNPANRTDPSGHCLQTIDNIGKIIGGISEFLVGLWSMPVTGPLGALVAVHGFDVALSGLLGLLTGTSVDTVTSQGLQALGMSQDAANFVDMCISILGSMGSELAMRYPGAVEAIGKSVGNFMRDESGALKIGKAARGGESAEAAYGRQVHEAFKTRIGSKPGWQSEPRLVDPKTGKTVIPDAVTPSGRPVELKPNTPSGRSSGKTQLKKYERATGKKGRVIYYDP
jgi:hypothetical protein